MKILGHLYRQSWMLLLFSIVTGIVSGISGAGLTAVIGSQINGSMPRATLATTFVALCVLALAAKTGSAFSLMHLVQAAVLRMRIDLSRQLLNTPYAKLQELGKPSLLAILTNDIATLAGAFQLLPIAFSNAVLIAACLGYLAWLSWSLFALIAAVLALGVVLYRWLERHPLRAMAALREHTDTLYRDFRGLIEGSRELQLNARRGAYFVDQVIAAGARENYDRSIDAGKGYTWADNAGTLMFYVGFGVLLFGAPQGLGVESATIARYTIVLLFLIGPIAQLMSSLPLLRSAEIALDKVRQLEAQLASEVVQPLPDDPFAHGSRPLHLELRGVTHRYPHADGDRGAALGPLDIGIRGGETLFVIGGNGSGKTTLAMILLGFHAPERGRLLLNGVAVTPENLGSYRQYYSAVFHDFHLLEHLLAGPSTDIDARAAHYLSRLGMANKVRVEDGRFSTIELSAGQRKRLALVLAYLEDRPVLLFDEWAADQDPAFKRVFYTELLPELKALGKTVIVITHDDAYFSCADRVVKIEDGRLRPMDGHAPALVIEKCAS